MRSILFNEKGAVMTIFLAIVVALLCMTSSVALLSMVQADQLSTQYQQDLLQEELLLRSDSDRTLIRLEETATNIIPDRNIQIDESHRRTHYTIKCKVRTVNQFTEFGQIISDVLAVKSLISAKRGTRNSGSALPAKRLIESLMKSQSLAEYQYITDTEESENADGGSEAARVKFWGPDVLNGPVHSNDDIWIQQAGGGNNDGWPTFHSMVTTTGEFKMYPSGSALSESVKEQIFLGGYQEHAEPKIFAESASELRANGRRPFDPNVDIVYVKIEGSAFTSKYCRFVSVGVDTFVVHNSYPDGAHPNTPIGDSIWVNKIHLYEPQWDDGPSGSLANASIFSEAQLWIEAPNGLTGKQTWGSADTVYITNDITYSGTSVGEIPDDENGWNRSDYFGLVSEKRIYVKYKHFDPDNGDVMAPNCDGDVYIYGAYAALGRGDQEHGSMACHFDGIFSFEYQHPHGSTPDFMWYNPATGRDTLLTFVDFHKFIFPATPFLPPALQPFTLHGNAPPGLPMCGYPYEDPSYPNPSTPPYGTDYPWYNPVWPESQTDIVSERGVLHNYGAIAQRRRGFIHRSGTDPYNHLPGDQMVWDIPNYHYDGSHGSTGYDKDYHYDRRFLYTQPPDYPKIYDGWGADAAGQYDKSNWHFKTPDTF